MAKISVPWRGVIEIVGEWDVGKTLAALQVVSLDHKEPYFKTVFVDDDEKGSGTVEQLKVAGVEFEKYVNLGELRNLIKKTSRVPTPDEYLDQIVFPVVEEISAKKHDVVIWDTWASVYVACRGHVERNQYKYKDVVTFKGTSAMIQGQISKIARGIEKSIIEKLKGSCSILILTHHLKDNYVNNVVAGKIPESSRTLQEICNMRIWLRRNPTSKVPIMLFLKRPNLPILDPKEGVKFINVVPMKIIPNGTENSIWDAMQRYVENPIESREPSPEETPSPEEFAILTGTLTDDQKLYVVEMLKYSKEQEEEISGLVGKLTGEPTLEEQVDSEYPPTPETGAKFVAQALKLWGMNPVAIKETLDVGLDKLMKMGKEELEPLWKILQENRN